MTDDASPTPAPDPASASSTSPGNGAASSTTGGEAEAKGRRLPILQGLLPIDRARVPAEILAGVTLAALAIPEVMGYTSIAGMPVITGLYTILLPVVAFALLGSSRHLVVGADSATAAVLAAGLLPLAAAQSPQYVALAGLVALMAAALLLIARLVGLGFLADFLSRTVLIGFLTGVGIQVACGQVGGLLGIPSGKGITIDGRDFDNTIAKLISTLQGIDAISWTTVAVSAGVLIVILGAKKVTTKVPGALIAVIGATFISWKWDLVSHGVATLGPVPGGLPTIGLPAVTFSDIPALMGTAVSIFVLILAQSAATSRAYAAKYNDRFDENVDLVGLGAANVMAGISGTFVVNGSPTKTQMVDGAGGKSQVAQLSTGAIVAIVLLFLTVPLQYMPKAVLASVVFLIGVQLVDLAGMRRIWRLRRDEFVVAALTAAVVVLVGVEQGIVIAIVASVIDHLRRSYRPPTSIWRREPGTTTGAPDGGREAAADADSSPDGSPDGTADWHAVAYTPTSRTEPGLVIYRFAGSIYYANASYFAEQVMAMTEADPPVTWIALDLGATPDIDLSGVAALTSVHDELAARDIRLVLTEVLPEVQDELVRYGLLDTLGADAVLPRMADVERTFHARAATA